MSDTMVIGISGGGVVRGLHYDKFDLRFLGPKQIGRASEILFDEPEQAFYIALPQLEHRSPPIYRNPLRPGFLTGFRGYDEARMFEVMILETCALNRIGPGYERDFYALGNECRTRFDKGDTGVFKWDGTVMKGC